MKKVNYVCPFCGNSDEVYLLTQKTNIEMNMLRDESTQMTSKKVGYIEQKLTLEINDINKRIESIPSNILLCDIEKRMGDLMDKFNYIKDIKDETIDKFNNIESSIENLKENNKNLENKINSLAQKEKAKENTTNASNSNSKANYWNKKDEETNSPSTYKKFKSYNSQKNINKYYLT